MSWLESVQLALSNDDGDDDDGGGGGFMICLVQRRFFFVWGRRCADTGLCIKHSRAVRQLWLVRTANNDKTRLFCPVGVRGVNWFEDKSRLSATENFETVLSSLEVRCELSLVLSGPSFHGYLLWHYLETGSRLGHKCIHTTDKTKLCCLQYIENCLRLSRTQFTPPTILSVVWMHLWPSLDPVSK